MLHKIDKKIFNNYVRAAEKCAKYIRQQKIEPKPVLEKYNAALTELRTWLDKKGYLMPKPLQPFDCRDTSTWFYSDVDLVNSNGVTRYRGATINPKARYTHSSYR